MVNLGEKFGINSVNLPTEVVVAKPVLFFIFSFMTSNVFENAGFNYLRVAFFSTTALFSIAL